MLTIPPEVSRFMIEGLTREIERQEAIFKECGDDWPDDCDPNDIAIYIEYREWLSEHSGETVTEEYPDSKPTAFVMALVPHFVRESIDSISQELLDAVGCTYAQYVSRYCLRQLEIFPEAFADTKGRYSVRKAVFRMLENVSQFPREPDVKKSENIKT